MEAGERLIIFAFVSEKLVFCESAAEECETITKDHSQCQNHGRRNRNKKKTKQRNVLDKESYMWLKINIQLQNEYCDGVTADLIKIIVSKGLWGAGKKSI